MKKFYFTAWFLLTAAFLTSVLTGTSNAAEAFVLSLTALLLVYSMAFWSIFTSGPGLKSE